MKFEIYDVPAEFIEPLKDAFYDVESYRTIMIELIKTTDDNTFNYSIANNFRERYKNALITYEKAKIDFEFNFVKVKHPTATTWNATFGDNKVRIEYT